MNRIIYLYFLIVLLEIILGSTIYKNEWHFKYILMYLGTFILSISFFVDNNIINKYILPIILFLNIVILIPITMVNKPKMINMLSILAILILLITFNYKELELKRGILINLNKKWIIYYILGLSVYFMLSNDNIGPFLMRIYNILLLVYPLIFPINEYFIHRGFSLTISCLFPSIYEKYSKYLKLI